MGGGNGHAGNPWERGAPGQTTRVAPRISNPQPAPRGQSHPSPCPQTHILQLFEATFQLLLSPTAFLEVLCKQKWLGSPGLRWWSSEDPEEGTTHHLSLLFHLLRVLGQLETHMDAEVLGHQLPLARKVIHLLENLHEGLLLAEPGARWAGVASQGQILGARCPRTHLCMGKGKPQHIPPGSNHKFWSISLTPNPSVGCISELRVFQV